MENLSKQQQVALDHLLHVIDLDNEVNLDHILSTTNEAFTSQLRTIIMEETQQHDRCYMIEMVQMRLHAIVPALKEVAIVFRA